MSATDIWLLLLAAALIAVAGGLAGADAALSRVSRLAVDQADLRQPSPGQEQRQQVRQRRQRDAGFTVDG